MGAREMFEELPKVCDVGTKVNSKGCKKSWVGYKLHIEAADGHIPISCVLTSALLYDIHAALPLAELTSQRVANLYNFMYSAYESPIIKQHSRFLNHIPIIDINTRGNKKRKLELKEVTHSFDIINFKTRQMSATMKDQM